ncbi:MAG TPA: bL17 family ribosomal protein [Ktedonobacterales bacterium]|nr:bL17 family ribosomal protein [Ktedonobacterales bacterium]
MRHRMAGNRINMPEPRRRAAVRSMVDGLFIWEHINTTDARAKVAQGEAERLIAIAIRGHKRSWEHLTAAVPDSETAERVLALARRARFSLDETVPSNEERAQAGKYPLGPDARKRREDRLAALKKEMLGIIKDHDDAQAALTAAREAMAIELHARRMVLKRLPREVTVKKIFEQFVPKYSGRQGGYTRITKLGTRRGDAALIVQLELV